MKLTTADQATLNDFFARIPKIQRALDTVLKDASRPAPKKTTAPKTVARPKLKKPPLELVRDVLQKHPDGIGLAKIIELTKVSSFVAKSSLLKLEARGEASRRGKTKDTIWFPERRSKPNETGGRRAAQPEPAHVDD